MEVCDVWLARDFLRRARRPLDIPPCQHSPTECPPIREGANDMTTEPNADWFDLCIDAELGKPHPPHAYSTDEPSGCPGHVGAATKPACNCFMRGGKHSFKCHLARNGRPGYAAPAAG